MKKIIAIFIAFMICVGLIASVSQKDSAKLSKEKQNEIVRTIISNYNDIESIEFKNYTYDSKVGEYRILFTVNGYENGLSFSTKEDMNKLPSDIGLNPVNVFGVHKKTSASFNEDELKRVTVKYFE